MAPEQLGGRYSPASDQYALATLAYLLLSGHTPFAGGLGELMRAVLQDPPPSLQRLNSVVSAAVEAVIRRALAKEPGRRYPSMAAFAEALRAAALLEGETTEEGLRTYSGFTSIPTAGLGGAAVGSRPAATPRRSMRAGAGKRASLAEYSGAPRVFATARDAGPYPPPLWLSDDASTHPVPGNSARPRTRRRILAFTLSVALLLLAAVAAIQSRPLGISRGFAPPPAATRGGSPDATSVQTPTAGHRMRGSDTALLVRHPAALTVHPGQRFSLTVTYANTGATTWTSADGYALVCAKARYPAALCSGATAISLGEARVRPGHRATFTVAMRAPVRLGEYTVSWNMRHNGALFGDRDAVSTITVRRPLPPPSATPKPKPTATPTPHLQPTADPTFTPVPEPTDTPDLEPTDTPDLEPTDTPEMQAPATLEPEPTATAALQSTVPAPLPSPPSNNPSSDAASSTYSNPMPHRARMHHIHATATPQSQADSTTPPDSAGAPSPGDAHNEAP
jgi:hypothetical protein